MYVCIDWGRGRFEWSNLPQISGAVLGKKGLAPCSPSRQRPWDEGKLERSRLVLWAWLFLLTGRFAVGSQVALGENELAVPRGV